MEGQHIKKYLKDGIDMNELLISMAEEMHIQAYETENETDYIKRVIYSAVGQWCLKTASGINYGGNSITKHRQTGTINNLLNQYINIFSETTDYFEGDLEPSVAIRKVYESTGYLITDEENRNSIARFGRTVPIGDKYLFFGEPFRNEVNGLGLFCNESISISSLQEFLLRDALSCDEYINSCFEITDFEELNTVGDMRYFNPHLDKSVSASWQKTSDDKFQIAKNDSLRQFLLLQKNEGKTYYKDFSINEDIYEFTAFEYRRLYFALKKKVGHPVKAWINKVDDIYSKITLSSHLPNREYYLLLLLAWPIDNMFNKTKFLIKNEFVNCIIEVLENIGVKGERNG